MVTAGQMRVRGLAWRVAVALLAVGCGACTTVRVEPELAPEAGAKQAMRATNADVHERVAARAMDRGLYAEAARAAREALRVDPTRAEAALLLARALLHSGSVDAAQSAANRALELRPDWPAAMLVRGDCAAEQQSDEEARKWYQSAAEAGSADAAFLLGVSLLRDDQDEQGERWLRIAAEGTQDPEPLVALASHHWARGHAEAAEAALAAAVAAHPGDRALQFKLEQLRVALLGRASTAGGTGTVEEDLLRAVSLAHDGNHAAAAAIYRDLAATRSDDPAIRVALGEALLRLGDAHGAESAFRSAAAMAASRGAMVGLARALLSSGRADEGVVALAEAVRLDPDHIATRSLLVGACVKAGDRERALREAAEVSLRSPGSELDLACRRLVARGQPSAPVDPELP